MKNWFKLIIITVITCGYGNVDDNLSEISKNTIDICYSISEEKKGRLLTVNHLSAD